MSSSSTATAASNAKPPTAKQILSAHFDRQRSQIFARVGDIVRELMHFKVESSSSAHRSRQLNEVSSAKYRQTLRSFDDVRLLVMQMQADAQRFGMTAGQKDIKEVGTLCDRTTTLIAALGAAWEGFKLTQQKDDGVWPESSKASMLAVAVRSSENLGKSIKALLQAVGALRVAITAHLNSAPFKTLMTKPDDSVAIRMNSIQSEGPAKVRAPPSKKDADATSGDPKPNAQRKPTAPKKTAAAGAAVAGAAKKKRRHEDEDEDAVDDDTSELDVVSDATDDLSVAAEDELDDSKSFDKNESTTDDEESGPPTTRALRMTNREATIAAIVEKERKRVLKKRSRVLGSDDDDDDKNDKIAVANGAAVESTAANGVAIESTANGDARHDIAPDQDSADSADGSDDDGDDDEDDDEDDDDTDDDEDDDSFTPERKRKRSGAAAAYFDDEADEVDEADAEAEDDAVNGGGGDDDDDNVDE